MRLTYQGVAGVATLFIPKNRLTLDPCIASGWSEVSLNYRFGAAVYDIEIDNTAHVCRGVRTAEVDLAPIERINRRAE